MPPTGHPPIEMADSVQLTHPEPELAWTAVGSVVITIDDREWRIDDARALWIPGSVAHTVVPASDALLLPVFFAAGEAGTDTPSPSAVPHHVLRTTELDALARALAQRNLLTPSQAVRARDRLRRIIARATADLPLPVDPRARIVAEALLADPARSETLEDWARAVHTSAKTLQRCFAAETGLRYPAWRTRARLETARRLLRTGDPIQSIAARVGYTSPAAFAEAFRRRYGHSPARARARAHDARTERGRPADSKAGDLSSLT